MGIIAPAKQHDSNIKFKNEELQVIGNEFCLQNEQIHQLYSCFGSFQSKTQAYLTLDDFAQTLHDGQLHFAELPYLQRLFRIISRKSPGKLFFQEYVVGISTFCLMNKQALLHFVFDWLDQDGDGQIDRQDLSRAVEYVNPRTNRQTFLCDFMTEVNRNLKQGQMLFNYIEFQQLKNKLLFLIWPAYELQQNLRERNMGIQFWEKQYLKIQKSEQMLRNSEKRSARMQSKIVKLNGIKIKSRNRATLKQKMVQRQPKHSCSDLQLLEVHKVKRRRSCPYLKGKLLVKTVEIQEQQQSAVHVMFSQKQ